MIRPAPLDDLFTLLPNTTPIMCAGSSQYGQRKHSRSEFSNGCLNGVGRGSSFGVVFGVIKDRLPVAFDFGGVVTPPRGTGKRRRAKLDYRRHGFDRSELSIGCQDPRNFGQDGGGGHAASSGIEHPSPMPNAVASIGSNP